MNLISTSFLLHIKEPCIFLNINLLNITLNLHLAREMEVRASAQKQSKFRELVGLVTGFVLNYNGQKYYLILVFFHNFIKFLDMFTVEWWWVGEWFEASFVPLGLSRTWPYPISYA